MSDNSNKKNNNGKSGPIVWMAGHSVAANLLMVIFLVAGLYFAFDIKKEVFPNFEMDWVMVSVSYPGASPEEVENGIVLAIEEAVENLDNVDEIRSTAGEGNALVIVQMLVGGDLQKLSRDVKSAVERITSFPEEAEDPEISEISRSRQVLSIVLYGDLDEKILRTKGEAIRDQLLTDPNITQVTLGAVRNYEMSIEVPQENLRAYNLTLQEIANKIKMASVELPSGSLKTEGGEILVRMMDKRDYGIEFAQIPIIANAAGTELRLGDIAVIRDGFEDTDHYATYNGKRALMINIFRVGNQTPMQVSEAAIGHIDELRDTMPPGLEVDVLNDRSEVYGQRLDLMVRNGFFGLVLVLVMLALFLEPRLAFWVTMGIPISFLGSFIFLPYFGVTLNMNAMFAFIVALGIVVDDAIVVGENVYKYRSQGYPFGKAAIKGAREVATPVTFAIITNVVTFLPICFIPGFMGKIFFVVPVIVITVIVISLIECLFILPAHLGHLKDKELRGPFRFIFQFQQAFSAWFTRMIRKRYSPLVGVAVRFRYITVSLGIAVLLLTLGFVASNRLGMSMMETTESDFAQATATLPYGTAVEKTEAVKSTLLKAAQRIIQANGGDKLAQGIYGEIGVVSNMTGSISGGHTTRVRVYLTPPEERTLQTSEFVELWREAVGEVVGLEALSFKSDAGGPGSGAALTIELSHKDLDALEAAGAELAAALSTYPMAREIDDGFQPGKQQIDFKILPEGRALGLTAQEVASQVRHAFYGVEVSRQQRDRNEIKVMVRLPKEDRISEYSLEELILRTPKGQDVPLRDVVEITRGRAYTSIERKNGRRTINVTADVKPRPLAGMINKSVKETTLPELQRKYPGLLYGEGGFQADINESMGSLFWGLGLALFVIYAVLAVPFRSYVQPLIIMSSIPFGIVGAIVGHVIMGYSLSLMSLFGIVALTGVVVNDSLVLINFTNNERQRGLNVFDALVSAGTLRFRAIMLTSLTTFGALIPLIFETSRQAKFMIPMAISLGFGVLFATGITLLLVPSIYHIVEDLRNVLGRFWRFLAGGESPSTETPGTIEG
jgi:multidrug efflux pump subunit AcrB